MSGDGFPAELSVSWRKGVTEVRILFEPVGDDPATRSVQDAGRAMVRALAGRAGVSIGGYEAVEDLFTSDDPPAHRSGVWLSLACGPEDPPQFKVYLNPYANGEGREWDTVTRAMDRLGLGAAWAPVVRRRDEIEATGTGLDYVALDLAAGAQARAKIYFRHRGAGLDGIHTVGAFARGYDPERAAQAATDLYGGADAGPPRGAVADLSRGSAVGFAAGPVTGLSRGPGGDLPRGVANGFPRGLDADHAGASGADHSRSLGADHAHGSAADHAHGLGADLSRGPAAGSAGVDGIANEPMTGLAFRAGRDRADAANIYFRMSGAVATDAEARTRITTLMDREGAPSAVYHRIADAIAPAPMETTAGLHELVSYRTHDAGPADIGVYYRLPVHAAAPDDLPRLGHGWPRVPF